MPTAIREQLLSAITTAVAGVYGLPTPEDERDLPVTIVQDGADAAADDVYDNTNLIMPVVVAKGALSSSTDRDIMRSEANALLADIITTMHTDETFGALADGINYSDGSIQAELGKFVFAEAQFSVRYHHLRGDPFTIE